MSPGGLTSPGRQHIPGGGASLPAVNFISGRWFSQLPGTRQAALSNLSLSTLSRNALPLVPGANQGSTKGQHTDTDVRGVSTVQVPGQQYHRRRPSQLVRQARDLEETVARRAYDNTTWVTAASLANLVTRHKRKQLSQATRIHTMIRASQTVSATLLTYVLGSEPRRAATRLKHSWLSSQMTDLIKLSAPENASYSPRVVPSPFCHQSWCPAIRQAYAQPAPSLRAFYAEPTCPAWSPRPFALKYLGVSWHPLAYLGCLFLCTAPLGKTWPPACQALGAP